MLNELKFINNVKQFVISVVNFDVWNDSLKMMNVEVFKYDVFNEVFAVEISSTNLIFQYIS